MTTVIILPLQRKKQNKTEFLTHNNSNNEKPKHQMPMTVFISRMFNSQVYNVKFNKAAI